MDKKRRAVFAALLVFAAALAAICAALGALDRPTIDVTCGNNMAGACAERMLQKERLFRGLKMDINEVGVDDLKLIRGIGDVKARKIIDLRERTGGIETLDDLALIPGIGMTDVRNLKNFLQ